MTAHDTHVLRNVLVIEGCASGVRTILEAFEASDLNVTCFEAGDGATALAFLGRTGEFADAPRPDLIVLDIDLPDMSGRDVLAEIKEDPKLRHIPVTVFTASKAEEDIEAAYARHANCFVTRPAEPEALQSAVEIIGEFWLRTARLPRD
jgi:two-component system, chemotaxis family, response regulator Rcp1